MTFSNADDVDDDAVVLVVVLMVASSVVVVVVFIAFSFVNCSFRPLIWRTKGRARKSFRRVKTGDSSTWIEPRIRGACM